MKFTLLLTLRDTKGAFFLARIPSHSISELIDSLNSIDSWVSRYKFPSEKDLKHIKWETEILLGSKRGPSLYFRKNAFCSMFPVENDRIFPPSKSPFSHITHPLGWLIMIPHFWPHKLS